MTTVAALEELYGLSPEELYQLYQLYQLSQLYSENASPVSNSGDPTALLNIMTRAVICPLLALLSQSGNQNFGSLYEALVFRVDYSQLQRLKDMSQEAGYMTATIQGQKVVVNLNELYHFLADYVGAIFVAVWLWQGNDYQLLPAVSTQFRDVSKRLLQQFWESYMPPVR